VTETVRSLWPTGGLWRHGDFLKLWSAETISQFGTQVSQLAIPLVALLVLDATAFEVAALGVVLFLPFMLFTLPAGVWVDRLPRRPILIAGDFGRFALLATIPIAYVADVLTLGQLYAVGFLVGVCTVFFDVAYQSYLPSLVERDQIIDGNSKMEISRSTAQISGPGLAGGLIEIFTAPYAVLVDSISFLCSGLFIFRIRKHEEAPTRATADGEPKPSMWVELKEGLRFVLGNPNLRAQAGCTATSNFFFQVAFSIFLVFLVRQLGISPGAIGVMFSVVGLGSLGAAFTATRLSGRFGIGPTTIVATLAQGPALLLIALAPESMPYPFIVGGALILGYVGVLYNIVQVSYRQAICPPRLQGRMNSVMRFIVWGTIPLGGLAGGALGTWIGLRPTLVIGAIGGGLAFLWILLSPQRHLREMPEPLVDEPISEEVGATFPGVADPLAPADAT
jgi:MFS family permease